MIPQLTEPLKKSIRTLEGILVVAVDAVLGAGAIIEPSQLPPNVAVKWAAILTGVHVTSRSLLKVFALQKGVGIEPPADASELEQAPGVDAGY